MRRSMRASPVVAVPGASAVTAAVAVSGLVDEPFVYLGFLPRKKGERIALLQSLLAETRPAIAFESPRRLRRSLLDMDDMLGGRRIAICHEMTKLHEEVFRGTASDALAHFTQPRGEFTLVIAGAVNVPQDDRAAEQMAASLITELRVQGARRKARRGAHIGRYRIVAQACLSDVAGTTPRLSI